MLKNQWRPAIVVTLLLCVITGVAYPALVTGLAQALFPHQANGSLVTVNGKVVGSALIGQRFVRPEYFHSRPSAAGEGYDAAASSGTNKGPTDRKLADTLIGGAIAAAVHDDGAVKGAIPSDMVTSSASGLDPDISPANAFLQIARVARARGADSARVHELVNRTITGRQFGFFGEPRVNVLLLNIALDSIAPTRQPSSEDPMKKFLVAALVALAAPLRAQTGMPGPTPADTAHPVQQDSLRPLPVRADSAKAPDSTAVPFAFADFTWLNGNSRQKSSVLDSKYFTGEFRADVSFIGDFNHPSDHTLVGTSESGRTSEFQVQQLGIGGDFHSEHAIGRLMTQFGMYSTMTPRNDASPARGQWDLAGAYRYVSEAYGGYHIDKLNGINIEAGIFMSYVGLFSYYNFDNWAYQPSYVSSNTPWFFNGMRVQIFTSNKLKIEPWLINGWQSYGMFNSTPGVGAQILWRPNGNVSVTSNNYYGKDWLGIPDRMRVHTDNSIEVKYLDDPNAAVSKAAFSFTVDAGCESGGGVSCGLTNTDMTGPDKNNPHQGFFGFMGYNRLWFNHDKAAVTLGAGYMTNPGRYLVLMPPINGATAFSGAPTYFTENPGDKFNAWDASATFDLMPDQFVTFRGELDYRHASVPYFSGAGGVTPLGGNTGAPGSQVPGFTPDLRQSETRLNFALLVKF